MYDNYNNYGNNENNSNYYSKKDDSHKFKKHQSIYDYTLNDLTKGKHLELITAALLLSGKIKVDAVQLFRSSPIITVTLIGKFQSNKKKKSNALADFLEENGNLTIDEVFEAIQEKMKKGDNSWVNQKIKNLIITQGLMAQVLQEQ